jgi:hypothetical protein
MSLIGLSHPDVLSSLILVQTPQELGEGSRIYSIALFTVSRREECEASFRLINARFPPIQDQEAIIGEICSMIPRDAQLLVRQPGSEYLQRADNRDAGHPLLDNGRLARALPNTTLLPLCCSDEQITASGEALGLDMPGLASTTLKRRCRAPFESMALWAIYLRHFSRKREVRELTAAFQAWHLLERVKPLRRR